MLDEPNAGLDPMAEHQLHADLMRFGAGRTRLLVSHRLGALREADQIVVLDAGPVSESGTHAELMAAGGLYRELFTVQAEPYQPVRREGGPGARALLAVAGAAVRWAAPRASVAGRA